MIIVRLQLHSNVIKVGVPLRAIMNLNYDQFHHLIL